MTALSASDLSAYRARTGWDGPARPDRATLAAIVAAQAATIPFENLDPLLGQPVSRPLGFFTNRRTNPHVMSLGQRRTRFFSQ